MARISPHILGFLVFSLWLMTIGPARSLGQKDANPEPGSADAPSLAPDVQRDLDRRRESLSRAIREHKATGAPMHEFRYSWDAEVELAATQVRDESDPVRRRMWLFAYLDLGYGVHGSRLDPSLCAQALAEIPATSPLWRLEPDLVGVAVRCVASKAAGDSYAREAALNHPDEDVRRIVRTRYSPDRRIAEGKRVPAFSVRSLGDSGIEISDSRLLGRPYLIDFWATFCAPCVEDIDNHARLYEMYKDQGLEIISLSVDEDSRTVMEFQARKRPMPWLNAMVPGGLSGDIVKVFEVSGLPRAVLVDRDGVITATNDEARGANLQRNLSRLFKDR